MITGSELMVKASLDHGALRCLMPVRYSVYEALAADYPVYSRLKETATVPDAHVFCIKPDGSAYIVQAWENVGLLPEISKVQP